MPVEVRQAGQQVACTCGTKLDVPPFSQLRHLPMAPETDDHTHAAWSVRHGVITAALLMAISLAGIGGYCWYTGPSLPKFDPASRMHVVENGIAELSPAAGWKIWVNSYLPLTRQGIQEFPLQNENAIRQQIARRKFIAMMLFIPAGIFFAAAMIAVMWRS